MKRQFKAALFGGVAAIAIAATAPATAQEITSSIRGAITTQSGQPAANVTVIVTNTVTGARRTFETNNVGAFLAQGLRPGGPYTIEVQGGDSFASERFENVYLSVGETLPIRVALRSGGIEEIQITAEAVTRTLSGAGSSAYDAARIRELPSISRDFKDALRTNPFVDFDGTNNAALSIGGSNNRFNSITVDGVRQDDDFGLNGSGVPTQRSPISIDAVEQAGVAVAPFDVQFNRFTGGQINVVTKSGTNEFHGSATYQKRGDGLVGNKSKDDDIDLGEFSNETFAATLGGPIIKDKLFFFGSYEKFTGTTPNTFGPEGSGATNEIPGITTDDVNRVIAAAQNVYGVDTLGLDADSIKQTDEKIFFKVDWNIDEDHRAFVSYQKTDGNSLVQQDTGVGSQQLGLLSHWYNRSEELEAWNAQLHSSWTDNFSTEIKFAFKENVTGQVSLAESGFGEVVIATAGGGRIYIGADDSRHANRLNNDTTQFKFKGEYLTGDHTLTFGYELDSLDVFNVFIQDALGSWTFDSVEDFENGVASRLDYQNAVTNNAEDAAAVFGVTVHTLYLQDEFQASDKLNMQFGLRYDLYQQNTKPDRNINFRARNGFSNTATLDGEWLLQPRFAFTYDMDDQTVIRGGAGIFSGGDPTVWVANGFSLDGQNIDAVSIRGNTPEELAVLTNGSISSIPQFVQNQLTPGNGNVAALDPNFDIPSVWKFNLAAERYFDFGPLGDDWLLGVEAIWTRTIDAANWIELRAQETGVFTPDGAPLRTDPRGFDILLTNANKGRADSYAFYFNKEWETFRFWGSYTYQDAASVNEGTSSTAQSNFRFSGHVDRNNRQLGISAFQRKNTIRLGATWRDDVIADDAFTTISAFYTGRDGRRFSLGMDFLNFGGNFPPFVDPYGFDRSLSVLFGDHLVYVPEKGDPNVIFTSPEVEAAFDDAVRALGLERGKSVPRNSETAPWVNDLDIRLSQEIPVGFGKVEVFWDIENFLNFLDSDMGRIEQTRFGSNPLVDADVDPQTGAFIISNVRDPRRFNLQAEQSVWTMQWGIRYRF